MEEKDIGKVVCVEANDKKKVRDNWFPCLVVAPTLQSSVRANIVEDYLVRSFNDGKYYAVPKKDITEFTKEIGARVENPTLKTAIEKAVLFLDKGELPPHWDKDLLFGINKICIPTDNEAIDSDNSDKESIEEKDHFVAQLFKFMDDRGTPLHQAPVINEKDVDLYKLFKIVNNYGGCKKVNKGKLWKFVANKAGHEQESFLSVKHCYTRYLHSYEDFYRKLGCTMWSRPRRVRSSSSFSRSIIRNIDKALPSTSSATDKNKCAKNELKDKKNKNSAVTKRTADVIITEEILLKNNEDISKEGGKKKEDIANCTLRNKQSVKLDPENITDLKDPVRNSKTKKKMKKIFKKEMDSDAVDDDQIIKDKKIENKIYAKSMQKTNNKEKVEKVKSTNTGLPLTKKMRAIREQIKTLVKGITPIKNSNTRISSTQQDASNKEKPDEEVQKLTRSKTKEILRTKSKRVLSYLANSASVVQLTQPGLVVKNQIKIKKVDGSGKKKTVRKKKDNKKDKVSSNDITLTPVNIENVPFDKDLPLIEGDSLVVYYGDEPVTTYDAKVIDVCDIEGVMKYCVHYKGWNSRYDEWIDGKRVAYKKKDQKPEPEEGNDADSSKSSLPEQKNVVLKKVPSITKRIRRSVTPLTSNSNIKKSPFSSARTTRTCTLTNHPLFNIDHSESELNVIIKTEPLNSDNQKKTHYPRTYPSKKEFMQRNAARQSKSCVFNVDSNKSEVVKICEQVTLKPPFDFNFVMPPPSDSTKPDSNNENVEVQKERNVVNSMQIEPKTGPNHYLLLKKKSKRNDLEHISRSSNSSNEEVIIKSKPFKIPAEPEMSVMVLTSENEEQNKFKKVTDVMSSSLDYISDESKISGTHFDLSKSKSELEGLMSTSINSNDTIQNAESFILDQQIEIEVSNEPVKDDAYKFKESKSHNFDSISSISEEKICRSIRYYSPKLFSFKKPDELPIFFYYPVEEEVIEQNRSMIPFVANRNNIYSSGNDVEIKVYENMNIINKIEDPIVRNQSENESYESQDLMISNVTVFTSNIKETEQYFQDEANVSDLKYEVLDLCMNPPRSPHTNIFSTSEHNELNDIIVEEDYDHGFAENDKEAEYQINYDHTSFNGQIEKNIEAESLPRLPPSKHSSSRVKRDCRIAELPELLCRKKMDRGTLNNPFVAGYCCKAVECDIHRPSTSKGFFDSINQPGTSKDSVYETNTSSEAKYSSIEACQTYKNVVFDTNIPEQRSLFDPIIPYCSSKDFYGNNIPSTSHCRFYENSLPSTNKSNFYNNFLPDTSKSFNHLNPHVSSALFCKEAIPGSPIGMSEEKYDQEERKEDLQALHEKKEAASAMYTMHQSFCAPRITLMGGTEEEMKEYTNILQKDGAILDQQHLHFLAEISSKNLGININEPSVTEPLEREPETIVEKIVNPPEKLQSKLRISCHENLSKHCKLSTTTAPLSYGLLVTPWIHIKKMFIASPVKKPNKGTLQPPIIDGKPVFVYTPNMDSLERQTLIKNRMDEFRRQHAKTSSELEEIKKKKR